MFYNLREDNNDTQTNVASRSKLITDCADNLSHNLIPFHRFMRFTNFAPIKHTVDVDFKFAIENTR